MVPRASRNWDVFATGEMGFRCQFARHQSLAAHVHFESKADIEEGATDVRFTSKSRTFVTMLLAHFVRDRRNQWQEGHVDGRSDL